MGISDFIRKEFAKADDERDKGLTTPEGVCRYDDICYGTDRNNQILDVYLPQDIVGKLPVIISVHGGGWVYGNKERYQFYCMDLAKRGYAVVNFTYRLAPEHKFPASLEDINLVMEWVLENAQRYKMDIDRIYAVGDSAGAHILCLYMDICVNEKYALNYRFKIPQGLKIQGLALNCGQYHLDVEEMDDMTGQLMQVYLCHKGTREELALLCADEYVTPKFPPTFIMTAENDFLRKQAPLLYQKLKEKQVTCELHDYSSRTEKKLGHVFHLDVRSEDARKCNDEECKFFDNIK